MEKILKGIYIVEKKWSLIWLVNSEKQTTETMDYFCFEAILHQSFTDTQIKKILEALNCEEKLLIDFDKEKVKRIVQKEESLMNVMKTYMNPNRIQEDLDYYEESVGKFVNF